MTMRKGLQASPARSRSSRRRGFSLIELLVVMGIIALMAGLTAVGYVAVAQDAKLSSGKNTLMSVLDNARSLAMKNNQMVLVVFRPRLEGKTQYVEAVYAQWARQSRLTTVSFSGGPSKQVVDRFTPMNGVAARALPAGIKIGAPAYRNDLDTKWLTQAHLPAIAQPPAPAPGTGEAPGALIGIMYGPDGTVLSRNSVTDSHAAWIDFDVDNEHDFFNDVVNYEQTFSVANWFDLFSHRLENDEPFVEIAPFLTVFDDDEVRELYDPQEWIGTAGVTVRRDDYSEYIRDNVDRIHFNRYTGVALK